MLRGVLNGGVHPDVRRVHAGDVARSTHFDGQPFLYHWAATADLPRIRIEGLRPGVRRNFKETSLSAEEYAKNLWFSAQPDRWMHSVKGVVGPVTLLRVPTDSVQCRYDGADWLFDGDEPEEFIERFDGRLTDCTVRTPVPSWLIERRTGKCWRPL